MMNGVTIYIYIFLCISVSTVNCWVWGWSLPWSQDRNQAETTTVVHESKPPAKENTCLVPRSTSDYPFFIGRTNLMCMLYYRRRRRRSIPSVYTMILTHRWLKYRGVYFEFGTNALDPEAKNRISIQPFLPNEGENCSYDKNPGVAGYSRLSVSCIASCTRRYPKVFGEYSLLTNNCHVFVNKMVEVLCNFEKCPDWCAEPFESLSTYRGRIK